MNQQFEQELKSLLKKHRIGLQLYCYDMVATLAYDDEDSSDNIICEQEESKYACTVVNDCLAIGGKKEEKEQAEKASEAYRKYHRLYKLAEELNPEGWEPDWNDPNQPKYIIRFNKNFNDAKTDVWYESEIAGAVFFASITAANKAIEILMDQE